MSTNKSVFRAEDEEHAAAIVEAVKACNFPTLTAAHSSTRHPGVSEFSVVVILDADADGWLSDLNGVAEAVIETLPPERPTRRYYLTICWKTPELKVLPRWGTEAEHREHFAELQANHNRVVPFRSIDDLEKHIAGWARANL